MNALSHPAAAPVSSTARSPKYDPREGSNTQSISSEMRFFAATLFSIGRNFCLKYDSYVGAHLNPV